MPMFIMAGATAALGIYSAFQQSNSQANQVEHDLALKKQQIEWNNHMQRLELARKNRAIAQKNAAQWAMNHEITSVVSEQAEEERAYLRHKIDNEVGMFSTQAASSWDDLSSKMTARGVTTEAGGFAKGGTAKAITHSLREAMGATLIDQNLSYENMDRDIDRKKEAGLAKRNFSYNTYLKYVSTPSQHIQPQQQADAVRDATLTHGLVSTGIQSLVAFKQAQVNTEITAAQTTQLSEQKEFNKILEGRIADMESSMQKKMLDNLLGRYTQNWGVAP